MAKEYLSQKNVPFTEHDVSKDRDAAMEMVEKTKQMGVPVIVIDDKDFLVGFNPEKLDELLSSGGD